MHRPMIKNYINIINYYIVFVNSKSYNSIEPNKSNQKNKENRYDKN